MRVKAINNFLVGFKTKDDVVILDEKGCGSVCFVHRKYDFGGVVTDVQYDPADDSVLDAVIEGLQRNENYLEGCGERSYVLHTAEDVKRVLA